MSDEKTPIEKLYDDPKSKNFVNHLINAYLPIYKSTKVLEFEDKKEHKCNVCNQDLIDAGTVFQRIHGSKDFMEDSMSQLIKSVKGEEIPREERAMIKHITHGAIMAWTGKETTTYLCLNCIENLLSLVTNGLLREDKNIVWIINKMKRSEVFNHFKENPLLDREEKEKVEQIQKNIEKKKVVTFGDLEVLQKLKAKMEAESKN